jgi:hypothetical protein
MSFSSSAAKSVRAQREVGVFREMQAITEADREEGLEWFYGSNSGGGGRWRQGYNILVSAQHMFDHARALIVRRLSIRRCGASAIHHLPLKRLGKIIIWQQLLVYTC